MSSIAGPGANLARMAGGKILRPGPALIQAARPLASPKRAEGVYPFQWNYPGPNSRMAAPNGSVAIPQIVAPATSATAQILPNGGYQVPEGYRLVLTDILLGAFAADWAQGSGQLSFTLVVVYSTGPRNVEFLQNITIPWGFQGYPFPLRGRLEFAPLDVLQVVLTNTGIPTPAASDYAYAVLNGFTYPTTESA